jgi:hypothetical protein
MQGVCKNTVNAQKNNISCCVADVSDAMFNYIFGFFWGMLRLGYAG